MSLINTKVFWRKDIKLFFLQSALCKNITQKETIQKWRTHKEKTTGMKKLVL